jgi:hypothetical protein
MKEKNEGTNFKDKINNVAATGQPRSSLGPVIGYFVVFLRVSCKLPEE